MYNSPFIRFTRLEIVSVENAIRFIDTHLKEAVTPEGLAEQFGISLKKLQKGFKLKTGNTAHAYQLARRIELAKQLLQETEYPLKKIASEVGVASGSYFVQAFKKNTGLTPHQYRLRQSNS